MSDIFLEKIKTARADLQKVLEEQAGRVNDIEEASKLLKKFNLDTSELDDLLNITKNVFKAAGVKIPKPETKE